MDNLGRARHAFTERDYAAYLEYLQAAQVQLPSHPAIIQAVARAYSLNGNLAQAYLLLRNLSRMGVYLNIVSDTVLNRRLTGASRDSLQLKFDANRSTVSNSTRAFEFVEMDLANEGLAYDPNNDRFFLSSIHKQKIICVDRDGSVRDFSLSQDSLLGIYGMTVDVKRRRLWACGIAVPQMKYFNARVNGKTFLYAFDLSSGKLIETIGFGDQGKHQIKDVVVSVTGEVFITDMAENAVYKVQDGKLVNVIAAGPFGNTLGLACSADGKNLFIADFVRGIFRLISREKIFSAS
jgi:hypothetical protein